MARQMGTAKPTLPREEAEHLLRGQANGKVQQRTVAGRLRHGTLFCFLLGPQNMYFSFCVLGTQCFGSSFFFW